jgi:serine/threonine protein kinase
MPGKSVGDYSISLDTMLGQGSYGIVYKGSRTQKTTDLVAAKYCKWEKEFITEATDQEANLMKRIPPHDNITKFLDYIKLDLVEDDIEYVDLWIILEFCDLKDLSIFARRFSLMFAQKLDIMLQCSRGLHHLHSQNPPIIHRDIKPQNILVSRSTSLPSPVFKLADFGISRCFESSPQHTLKTMTAGRGTFPYMAPELFADNPKYNESVDTYSFGVSSLTLLCSEQGKRLKAVSGECNGVISVYII